MWTEGDDEAAISAGIAKAYQETNLRYSQLAPLSMFEEQKHPHQPPGPNRGFRRAGHGLQVHVHGQRRRLGQQELPLPRNPSFADPRAAALLHRRQAAHDRHGRLPALSPRLGHRRHLSRAHPQAGQARQHPLSRQPANPRQRVRPSLPRLGDGSRGAQAESGNRHWSAVWRQVLLPRRRE